MGDWSALPGELLCLVSDSLGLMDYLRFAAVCISWRQAVAGRRRHPPLRPQPPWLMSLPCSSGAIDLFCLADKTSYRLELLEPTRHRRMIGSGGGWLVTADEAAELHMLNPITGAQVRLPSILTLPIVDAVRDADGSLTGYDLRIPRAPGILDFFMGILTPQELREVFYQKVALSYFSSSDWTAVLMICHGRRLAFARAGDRAWALLPLPGDDTAEDLLYHTGKYYVLQDDFGTTAAWDLTVPYPQATLIRPPYPYSTYNGYLVGSGDDLLQVRRQTVGRQTVGFHVFRLDQRRQKWVRVENLGERALFLNLYCSISVSTLEYPELKRNCIYFTINGGGIGVFNLEDECIDRCYLLNRYPKWPPPVWIMPRPC